MGNLDEKDRLKKDEPFDYQFTKNGKTRIFYENREVMFLSEKDTIKLKKKIEGKSSFEIQLALAKVTGNFKHGNEKMSKK